MNRNLLDVKDLTKHFPVMKRIGFRKKSIGAVQACNKVSFTIREGETLGLVGESGCGKTTTSKVILNLIPPDEGKVYFDGKNVFEIFRRGCREEILELRRKMQLIFQNPVSSLNPRWTVADIVSEGLTVHKHFSKEEWTDRLYRLLASVGLADYHAERYPHEFSGGQRQRICIARVLAVEPSFIIGDEPVSSLDVSVKAQILNLLKELQERMKLTYLYISHDLSSVRYISDRVAVMYLGKIVESADVEALYDSPKHPYTEALLSVIPVPDPDSRRNRIILSGEVPSAINPPSGCSFHPRCQYVKLICRRTQPEFVKVGLNHYVACHKYS